MQTSAKDKVYARVGKYFAEMGVGDGVMSLLFAAPNNSIHWLTRTELMTTKLATDWLDAEQLITGVEIPEVGVQDLSPAVQIETIESDETESAARMPGFGLRTLPSVPAPPVSTGSVRAPAKASQ